MKISLLPPLAQPLTFGDEMPVNNNGATVRTNLQQVRDFFGVGTNIIPTATYALIDAANPAFGKNGDLVLTVDTNRLYKRAVGAFPAENAPTAILQGTRIDDTQITADKSWSSQKIDEYIRGAVAVVLDLAPNVPKRVPFFAKVLLESLRVSLGTDSFQVRLLLADGTVVISASGAGAATIGQVSVSIGNLTNAQSTAGYNVEFTNTSAAPLTALVRTIPL